MLTAEAYAAGLCRRRIERDPQIAGGLHVGGADGERLVGARDFQTLHLGQHGQRSA